MKLKLLLVVRMNNLIGIGMITERIVHFPVHAHLDYWEVVCYIEGSGVLMLGTAKTSFERGTVALIPPGCGHEELADAGFRNFHLALKNMDFPPYPLVLQDTPTGSLEKLLSVLYEEAHLRRPGADMLCQHLLDAIRSLLVALLPGEGRSVPVERVKAVLIHNLSNPEFQLEQALAPLGLSMGYLRRIFKLQTGETPHEYLTRLRMAHAMQLLSHNRSGASVARVSALCGFQDPYYFSRLFRRHTGASPAHWRQRLSKERDQSVCTIYP